MPDSLSATPGSAPRAFAPASGCLPSQAAVGPESRVSNGVAQNGQTASAWNANRCSDRQQNANKAQITAMRNLSALSRASHSRSRSPSLASWRKATNAVDCRTFARMSQSGPATARASARSTSGTVRASRMPAQTSSADGKVASSQEPKLRT